MSDELADAERYVREYMDACVGGQTLRELRTVMAEYDKRGAALANEMSLLDRYERRGEELTRLRLVEQAATALVEEWEAIRNPADKLVWTIAEQLTERLAAAVRGEAEPGPSLEYGVTQSGDPWTEAPTGETP